MPKAVPSRPHTALMAFCVLLLNACIGSGAESPFRPGATERSNRLHCPESATQDATARVCEVPYTAEQPDLMAGRLLGGMQQPALRDHKVHAAAADTKTAATQYGLRVHAIDTDGNCLFRAIADQLQQPPFSVTFSAQQDYHSTLRQLAVAHVQANRAAYQRFFPNDSFASLEDWLTKMGQNKCWGGQVAIRALADALQVTLVAMRAEANVGEQPTICKPARSSGVIYLHFKNGNHYESLSPLSSMDEAQQKRWQVLQSAIASHAPSSYAPPSARSLQQIVHSHEAEAKAHMRLAAAGDVVALLREVEMGGARLQAVSRTLAGHLLSLKVAPKWMNELLAAAKYDMPYRSLFVTLAGDVYKQGGAQGLAALLHTLDQAPTEAVGLQHLLLQASCVEQCLAVAGDEVAREALLKQYERLLPSLRATARAGWSAVRQAKRNGWGKVMDGQATVLHNVLIRSLSALPYLRAASGVVALYAQALKGNQNRHVRYDAARALGQLGDSAAVQPLLAALSNDQEGKVRYAAARALGQLGDKAAAQPLLVALENDDEGVREPAAHALGQLGEVSLLQDVLRGSQHSGARRFAAHALGNVRAASAVPLLLNALKNDEARVQGAAATALGQLGGSAAMPLLKAALQANKSENVRSSVAAALGQLGDSSVIPHLHAAFKEDASSDVRLSAASALIQLGDKAIVSLLGAALQVDESEYFRGKVAALLGRLADKRVALFLEAALQKKDEDVYVHCNVAEALGELGAKSAIPLLEAALKQSEHASLRREAASALGKLSDRAAVTPLLNAFKNDKDKSVRRRAVTALSHLGHPYAVSPLLDMLKNDKDVHHAASEALSKSDTSLLIEAYCQSVVARGHLPLQHLWTTIDGYCGEEPLHALLLSLIVRQLYAQALVIEGQQITLYSSAGSQTLCGLPPAGIQALQADLNKHYEEVLKSAEAAGDGKEQEGDA